MATLSVGLNVIGLQYSRYMTIHVNEVIYRTNNVYTYTQTASAYPTFTMHMITANDYALLVRNYPADHNTCASHNNTNDCALLIRNYPIVDYALLVRNYPTDHNTRASHKRPYTIQLYALLIRN